MNLIEGEIYKVNHSRKGVFNLMITTQDETWVTGLIVEGKAGAILEYNEREQFENITIRKELCKFQAVNQKQKKKQSQKLTIAGKWSF